jgi:hypothetical protein
MVFVGSENAPAAHCGRDSGDAYTVIEETPVISEKPYIVMNENFYGDTFSLMVPNLETAKKGPTTDFDNATEISFEHVYVASDSDSAATINEKLAEGLHLVLQPGLYKLDDTINIENAGTVVLGLGLATLIPTTGKPAIKVANVDGVKVAGVLLQAGTQKSPALLQWGEEGYAGNAEEPGMMHDVFARVGGPDYDEVSAEYMVQINSGNVIVDDTWLWRADHDVTGTVGGSKNPVATGM